MVNSLQRTSMTHIGSTPYGEVDHPIETPLCKRCTRKAVCTTYGCWKQREGLELDCENCSDRYCRKHWQALVKNL